MKRVLALTLAMVMLMAMFSGCTKTETDATAASGGSESADGTESTEGKNIRTDLVSAEPADIVTFDPAESTDSYSNKAINLVFDTLVDLDENSEFIPGLAESWEYTDDTTLVFKIRENVKFHNGEILTPSDIKFTMDRVAETPQSKNFVADVEEVIADDENMTVTFKMKQPSASLMVNLTEAGCHILNQKAVEEAGDKVAQTPVGTGPMKLKEWKVNNECILERFDEHWAGTPKATSITLRVMPESNSRTIALETGEVDMVTPISAIDIARIKENPDLKTLEMESSTITYLSMNHSKAPFDNLKVRQAVHYACDKQSLIDVIYEGYALPGISPFPTIMPYFDESLEGMYTYDIEKAKALMAEAGFPNGLGRPIEICVSSDERNRAAQILQSSFAEIGIQLDIAVMEFGTLMEHCNNGTHDMFIMGWGHATNQDRTMTNNFYTESIGPTGNRQWYSNPEVDKLIEEGRRELDTTKREQIYKDLQRIIMEDVAWVPLFQQINVYGLDAGLEGVIWHKRGTAYYADGYVVED